MTNPTIEKAARAFVANLEEQIGQSCAYLENSKDIENVSIHGIFDITEAVRAVFLSIREPDEAMKRAGLAADSGLYHGYQAMIDAILKEGA